MHEAHLVQSKPCQRQHLIRCQLLQQCQQHARLHQWRGILSSVIISTVVESSQGLQIQQISSVP